MIEDADERLSDENQDDDDELEEVSKQLTKKGPVNKESERRKRELITMGKAKGFLTYDEVNDHMPESIVSSDQIDDWLSTLGGEGIEIVDASTQVKVEDKGAQTAEPESEEEGESETAARPAEVEDEEEDDGYSKTNDPVRMYLRKMGSVSLLTREGEVEIAKRIEEGERRVLQVVLNSPVAIDEILELGEKLRKQKVRVKEVVKDADDDEEEFDENFHVERVCKIIDKVRRIYKDLEKVDDRSNDKWNDKASDKSAKRGQSDSAKKKNRSQVAALKQELLDALQELRLNKKQIDRVVLRLKGLVSRIESARREISEREQRLGMSERELKKTMREARRLYAQAAQRDQAAGLARGGARRSR